MQCLRASLSVAFCAAALLTAGCAHKDVEKKLDEKLASNQYPTSTSAIEKLSSESLAKVPNLSEDQRRRLLGLQEAVRADIKNFHDQELKLRAILVQDILAPQYNEEEVRAVKDRMKTLQNQRLTTVFEAADRANDILGRPTPEHNEVMRNFFENQMHEEY